MDVNDAKVSSAELTTLQSELVSLSDQMHELYELMNSDVSSLGEAWRDLKYDEFLTGYKPQMDKMEEIADRYREWATKDLQITIDHVNDYDSTSVSGDAVGASGVSSGGDAPDSSSSSAPANPFLAGNKKKADEFKKATKDINDGKYPESSQSMDPAIMKKWYDDHTERGAKEREYPHQGIIKDWEKEQQEIEMKKRENQNMFSYLMNKDNSR